jgi:hypothetical protein
LDLHESGIIEKPFKKTSTAICFQFFIFDLEFLKQTKVFTCEPQSIEQLMPLPRLWNTVWQKRSRFEHTNREPNKQEIGFNFA